MVEQQLEYRPLAPGKYPRAPGGPGRWIALLLAVGVVALCLNRKWLADKFLFGGYTEWVSRQQINQIGAMRIPASATDVKARVRSWQDTLLVVRFSIPPGDLTAFLDSTGIRRPLSTTEAPSAFKTEWYAPWWRPGRPVVFEAGEGEVVRTRRDAEDGFQWEETVLQAVLIDESDPQKYIVWMWAAGD